MKIVPRILKIKQEEDPNQRGASCSDVAGTATVFLELSRGAFPFPNLFYLQSFVSALCQMLIEKVGSGVRLVGSDSAANTDSVGWPRDTYSLSLSPQDLGKPGHYSTDRTVAGDVRSHLQSQSLAHNHSLIQEMFTMWLTCARCWGLGSNQNTVLPCVEAECNGESRRFDKQINMSGGAECSEGMEIGRLLF